MSDKENKTDVMVYVLLALMFLANFVSSLVKQDRHGEILEAIKELKQQKVEQIEKPNTIEKVIL